jgi:AAA15 family ATPase/GTPase
LVQRVPRAKETYPGYLDLVRAADLEISDIRVEERDLPSTEVDQVRAEQLEQEIRSLRQAIQVVDESSADQLHARVQRLELNRRSVSAARRHRSLVFVHGDGGALMTEAEQSAGTIAYLDILSDVLDALATGGVIVIDELGTSLHPRLLARLIELFRDKQTNPDHAQLIFATHDATLLGTSFGEEVLRRDEIWFTEKHAGSTTLYPLTDFHPRKEDNRERRYLGGSYGGVPAVFSDTLVEQLLTSRPESTNAAS